jgi:2-dehydro-3-deoxyphosphogluconate aldolase/(4S)-4-hydroxy-2-oxoglutarate aldolase
VLDNGIGQSAINHLRRYGSGNAVYGESIKNAQMAEIYIQAGVDFIICPGRVEEVANVADKNKTLWVPGCMTPSEIIHAGNLSAKMIKLFPGNILKPEFMTAIKALFPDLMFYAHGRCFFG